MPGIGEVRVPSTHMGAVMCVMCKMKHICLIEKHLPDTSHSNVYKYFGIIMSHYRIVDGYPLANIQTVVVGICMVRLLQETSDVKVKWLPSQH